MTVVFEWMGGIMTVVFEWMGWHHDSGVSMDGVV